MIIENEFNSYLKKFRDSKVERIDMDELGEGTVYINKTWMDTDNLRDLNFKAFGKLCKSLINKIQNDLISFFYIYPFIREPITLDFDTNKLSISFVVKPNWTNKKKNCLLWFDIKNDQMKFDEFEGFDEWTPCNMDLDTFKDIGSFLHMVVKELDAREKVNVGRET